VEEEVTRPLYLFVLLMLAVQVLAYMEMPTDFGAACIGWVAGLLYALIMDDWFDRGGHKRK
jgi:hypothetical protein